MEFDEFSLTVWSKHNFTSNRIIIRLAGFCDGKFPFQKTPKIRGCDLTNIFGQVTVFEWALCYFLGKSFLEYCMLIFYICYFQVGERIRVILDCDDNTLAFERNYEFLGVAFRGNFTLDRF